MIDFEGLIELKDISQSGVNANCKPITCSVGVFTLESIAAIAGVGTSCYTGVCMQTVRQQIKFDFLNTNTISGLRHLHCSHARSDVTGL